MSQVNFISYEAASRVLNGTTTTVNAPAGIQDGDLLITFFTITNNSHSVTTLSGWTLIDSVTTPGTSKAYWKIAASEGASYTWTHGATGTTASQLIVMAFRNAHATNGVVTYTAQSDGVTDTTATGLAVTPTEQPDSLLVALFYAHNVSTSFSAYTAANNNPSWTEMFDLEVESTSPQYNTTAGAYGRYATVTTTGDITATIANSSPSHVWVFSIRPAGQTISPPVISITATPLATTSAVSVPIGSPISITTALQIPTTSSENPNFSNTSKNAASMSNTSKNSASFTNTNKNSASVTNVTKN